MPLDSIRPDSRRQEIIYHAASLFGARGYGQTSMRDIAAAAGILPGSVYHHFASKEALLAAVYAGAIDGAVAELEAAVATLDGAWDRLEAACAAHLRMLLSGGALAAVVVDGRRQPPAARAELVREWNRYEAVFRRLVAATPLPPGVQSGPFRLALLGALNWALTWYRPGGDAPDIVARDLFAIFRASHPQEPVTTP